MDFEYNKWYSDCFLIPQQHWTALESEPRQQVRLTL